MLAVVRLHVHLVQDEHRVCVVAEELSERRLRTSRVTLAQHLTRQRRSLNFPTAGA
jgi:hypothetical protein